jgi:hypothetical protein
MHPAMIALRHHFQIPWAVVCFVAIDVMNYFTRHQWPSKRLCSYNPVLMLLVKFPVGFDIRSEPLIAAPIFPFFGPSIWSVHRIL